MPRAVIDGDRVRLTGVRNFDYRTRNDFTVRYEEREVLLSHLIALDFYVSYFTEGPVGHTFVSFIFDNAPPLSISIETRPEVGEGFAPVASLFKQFELIYVVGDERDLVRVRTNYRGEPVYLYRLNTSADDARRLLLVYLGRINQLADHPEFYNLLTNSCTINIVRYANAAGRSGGFDIRHLLNGLIDGYLYYSGRMDTTLPFDELRRRSRINEAALAADGAADFSERIQGIPADDLPLRRLKSLWSRSKKADQCDWRFSIPLRRVPSGTLPSAVTSRSGIEPHLEGDDTGNMTRMFVPRSGSVSRTRLPLRRLVTILWTMCRPSPVQPLSRRVVKKGSKAFRRTSSVMPQPSS